MSLREILEGIYEEHGELTPGLILDLARDPHHPLHAKFEWDDSIAAEKFRKSQARAIIREVKVRYVDPADETHTIKARVYHAVRTTTGTAYRSTDDVMADPFTRRLLRQQMHRDWQSMMARYKDMDELWLMIREAVNEHEHLEIAS